MSSSGPCSPVFLVDDNPDDQFIMRQRLQRAGIENPIVVLEDGEEAMAQLKRALADGSHALPGVVFLDLRMPRCGGFEVLKWIRSQPGLTPVRVVIVSTSSLPEDAVRAIQLGAERFLPKYPSPDTLAEIVRTPAERSSGSRRNPRE